MSDVRLITDLADAAGIVTIVGFCAWLVWWLIAENTDD